MTHPLRTWSLRLGACLLWVALWNCASKPKATTPQHLSKSHALTTLQKPDGTLEEVYVPQLKSQRHTDFPDTPAETRWVDSVYNRLDLTQKIGQLFMVAAYSNKDTTHIRSIEKLIQQQHIGGVIFFQGGPVRQARLTNRYQALSKVPLFVGIDAEWGLSMRLDSTYRYPWNMTLGAVRDLKSIEAQGRLMARECKRLGVHFNFAPVLDINTNPKNPIIGNRSFGENKIRVTDRALALMRGIQSEGVFCTGKHFPGHGDTSTDSHSTLPLVNASREHLDVVELYPYKRLFDEGLVSVMVAHLQVPELEPRIGTPTSVSSAVVTDLLQGQMGFDGLIFTDALNMKGAANFKKPGELDLDAFKAGNDILLFPENVPAAAEAICMALQDSVVPMTRLEQSVRKILKYKYKAGLHRYEPVKLDNVYADLNPPESEALQYQLFGQAITLIKNDRHAVPVKHLPQKIAYVKLGDDNHQPFLQALRQHAPVDELSHPVKDSLLLKAKPYDWVIVGYHKADKAWKKHDLTPSEAEVLQALAQQNNVIFDAFTKPYSLLQLPALADCKAVLVSYQNHEIAQQLSAQIIFGAASAQGQLPVTISEAYPLGHGLTNDTLPRLGYDAPANQGLNPRTLQKIDAVVQRAIQDKLCPGAQVLVARHGKVVYHKAFGKHTYDSDQKVKTSDLYDLASLTKMLGTLPLVIQQYDKHHVQLDTRLDQLVPALKNTDKAGIPFKALLSHYAGLPAWIPFYKATLDSTNKPDVRWYRNNPEVGFDTPVSRCWWIQNTYRDSIFNKIHKTPLTTPVAYKYSDLTFYLLQEWLERVHNASLAASVQRHVYDKMGVHQLMYQPWQRIAPERIVPTEIDTYFRRDTLRGYVHDMGAAMLGGVAGHAGLFGNAFEVAKIMQLYLQKGQYGHERFFDAPTFDVFNHCYFAAEGNRRGLGFDKPQLGKEGPTCGCVSRQSFGHTGFTGTMAWADPDTDVIYVFLSNRTYPDSNAPNGLSKANIREQIQHIIQDAIQD